MALVSRDFKICDRCQTEVQVYEIDDEGTMSDYEWLAVATNPDRKGYHLCPECTQLFRDFMSGFAAIPPIGDLLWCDECHYYHETSKDCEYK